MSGKWRGADDWDREHGYWTWRPDERGRMRRVKVQGEAAKRAQKPRTEIRMLRDEHGRGWSEKPAEHALYQVTREYADGAVDLEPVQAFDCEAHGALAGQEICHRAAAAGEEVYLRLRRETDGEWIAEFRVRRQSTMN